MEVAEVRFPRGMYL